MKIRNFCVKISPAFFYASPCDISRMYMYRLVENWGYNVRQSIVSLGSSLHSFQSPVFLPPPRLFLSSCYRRLTIFQSKDCPFFSERDAKSSPSGPIVSILGTGTGKTFYSHWCGEGGNSEGWATVELQVVRTGH